MSRRRALDQRLHTLGEIREILGSMRSLALLETRKLARAEAAQREVMAAVQRVAEDFRSFHPQIIPVAGLVPVTLVVGSERGFVGDFNQRLLEAAAPPQRLIAVGDRLNRRLQEDPRIAARLDGPSSAEEVDAVIGELVTVIGELAASHGPLALTALYHVADAPEPRRVPVFPPYRDTPPRPVHAYPPRLNLAPERFLLELLDQYLYSALHGVFLGSLMAENQRRLQHLDGAVRRLDEQAGELALHQQAARQEEITEELELIVQNADAMTAAPGRHRPG